MRKRKLALADLTDVGGEDLKSTSAKKVEKARRVEKCWALMARLLVCFTDLEQAPANLTAKPSRRRRGEGHFSEAIEITRVSETETHHIKPNEINDLADSAPVGDPDPNPEVAP